MPIWTIRGSAPVNHVCMYVPFWLGFQSIGSCSKSLNPVATKLGSKSSKIEQGVLFKLMRSKVAYQGQRSSEVNL